MPVFQEANGNGPTGKSMTYQTIKDLIVKLGHRAGYTQNITMHAIRRAFLNSVNKHYSTAQRNQVAGHSGRIFEEAYQSHVSNVDGYAMMTGKDAKAGHASILQSMALSHVSGAPTRLPTRIKDEMLKEKDYCAILDQLKAINQSLGNDRDNQDLLNERRKLYDRRSQCERDKLLEYQKMLFYQQESSEATKPITDFSILRSFMPERDRLADSLFKPSHVREGRQILADLLHLARVKNSESFYRPGEEPVNGKCPFNDCKQTIDQYVEFTILSRSNLCFSMNKLVRSNHIHHCHKKELRRGITVQTNWYPRFCYHCNSWLLNAEEWSKDREKHMDDPPVYCNVLQYRHVLIRPGLCPYCLGKEQKSATFRFNEFRKKIDLEKHLNDHLGLVGEDGKLFCPHPKCRHNVENGTLMDHFESVHSITPAAANRYSVEKPCKRNREIDSGEEETPKKKRKPKNSSNFQDEPLSLDDEPEDFKNSNVPPLEEDLEYSNWSSPNDLFEDFNHESLFVDGWEKEWEVFLDTDPWAVSYHDSDILNINPDFSF